MVSKLYRDADRIVDEDLPPGCVLYAAGKRVDGVSYPLEYAVGKALLVLDLAGIRRCGLVARPLPVPSLN